MNSMIILASLLIIYLKNNLLLGDLNINVLDHDIHPPTNELFSHFPNITFFNIYIYEATRLNSNSKTLIDNKFSNMDLPL